ncbi:MAG: hypothetical protein K940chlam7_01871 [Chlamydiae bacterium]|nr:hypothetical protein [Chlamydiota bacterium]
MTKKSSQVLADAVIVIGAHEERYWEILCNAYQIALPATILEEEIFYFQSAGIKKGLAPSKWVNEGKVIRVEAEIEDYDYLNRKLSKDFMNSLDLGELEALALLSSKKYNAYRFTTADRAAIKALGVLGWESRGISVEELLEGAGRRPLKQKLPRHFTKQWFQNCLHEGFMEQHLWLRPQ